MSQGIDRIGALNKAFEFIYKSETQGDYYEFGVYKGVSLARAMAANIKWKKKTTKSYVEKFFGFDSFSGLPEFTSGDHLSDYKVFQPGQFSETSVAVVLDHISEQGIQTDDLNLIPGFYSESLVSEKTINIVEDSLVAIAHIDCDLYSSALDCLQFLEGRLADGAVILFDDWFCYRGRPDQGVHKAFNEWCKSGLYIVSDYFSYSWAGRAFIINSVSDQ
ncbi:TylF/MycF/NovP-related O-methyltransferase [Hahella ganghwensis]|uniref:TylF/MycF/NovP-related O-methyltransferase n=1 Tax=Hahella ganghwensis TaxID=286420 RepID=UPI00037C8E17|nr:TylF/MycF/NovP-related O-methyltransferase [Hahella ganghwensis]